MTAEEYEKSGIEAARIGGEYLRSQFRKRGLEVEQKGRHDYVTAVDREAERRIREYLTEHHPDHEIMGEEGSPEKGDGTWRWIVDPLDGTTNFIHGVATFAVSIGLEGPDGLVAGIVYDPIADEMFSAHRGGGARLNGRPIEVSRPEAEGNSLIATGFPFRELSRLDPYLKVFEALVRSTAGLRRAGSAAIDLAYTAAGRYDGFWEVGLSRWDVAAGIVLVREAGGLVTDLHGGETMLDSGDVVAASAGLHSRILVHTREHFSAG